jgi:FMN phosphatase YigB (HAD superfamily)
MGKVGIVIFDMDDTLVDKETVFVEAQRTMLQTLAEHDPRINPDKDLGMLGEIDHELVRLHGGKHAYKSWKLAEALWLHFHEGKSGLQAAALAFKRKKANVEHSCTTKAAKRHDDILESRMPRLLSSAKKVLRELKKKYALVLFPSGEKKSQLKVIKHLGLNRIFD